MLSFEEHPGIISFLGGIVILVMAAVGLSLVVDRRLKSSAGSVGIQREIGQDASALDALRVIHERSSRLLNESGTQRKAAFVKNEEIAAALITLGQRQVSLEERRRQLCDSIVTLEKDFLDYRADYRHETRAAAIGERLGNLALRGGREYKDATITRVTDVGLEIRHSDGIARIQAPDLDLNLQDRFQWNNEDRRKVLKEELKNQEGDVKESGVVDSGLVHKNPKPPVRQEVRSQTQNATVSAEVVTSRQLVSAWQAKVSLLSGEHQEAMSRAGYSSQTSVPGSLETWSARASRLGNALARGRGELAAARARLAAVAPNDPLLRPSLQER